MYGEAEYAYVMECFSALEGHMQDVRCNIPLAQYAITSTARDEGFPLTMGYGPHGLETPVLEKCLSSQSRMTLYPSLSEKTQARCIGHARHYADAIEEDPFFYMYEYPSRYRHTYERHAAFLDGVTSYSIRCHGGAYDEDARPLESVLMSCCCGLSHLDEGAKEIVQSFFDTVDNIVLKELILCEKCPSCRHQLWEAVEYLYNGPHCGETVWMLIAPYIQSLEGPSAGYERIRAQETYDVMIGRVGERVASLERMARRMGIYPSLDELQSELCGSCSSLCDKDITLINKALEDLD